jgi:hypothetical protein
MSKNETKNYPLIQNAISKSNININMIPIIKSIDKKLCKMYFSNQRSVFLNLNENNKDLIKINNIDLVNSKFDNNYLLNKKRKRISNSDSKILNSIKEAKTLKISNTNLSLNENINCIICICNIEKNDCIYLRCGHYFHNSCINDWIKEKANCPICKENIYHMKTKTNGIDFLINLIRAERHFYELLNIGILMFTFLFFFLTVWRNFSVIKLINNYLFR